MKKFQKSFTSMLLALMLIFALPFTASAATVSDFTDVSPNNWYYGAVEYATDNGLFSGTTNTTFSPNAPMTRGMFVTVLGRLNGVDTSQYLRYRFNDVKQGDYYAPYVEWAAGYGIVSGTDKQHFSPNQRLTREQMAAMLYRYAQKTNNDVTYTTEKYETFPDRASVSKFGITGLQWATSKGIISGDSGKLKPQGYATRAQVAQVFKNSQTILINKEISDEPNLPSSSDPKADPNNVYNVFAKSYRTANDWHVSTKSRMNADEQEQLISLLQDQTGDSVWNEIALEGYSTGQIGQTRDVDVVNSEGETIHWKRTSLEKLTENVKKEINTHPNIKYFCITLADTTDSTGNLFKDCDYMMYFINNPEAHVNATDSAFMASVKQKVAERLPSNFIWSDYAVGGGWSCVPLLDPYHTTEEEQAEDYADFFVYMLTEGWGERSGAHYCITPANAVTTTQLPEYNSGFENLVVWYS